MLEFFNSLFFVPIWRYLLYFLSLKPNKQPSHFPISTHCSTCIRIWRHSKLSLSLSTKTGFLFLFSNFDILNILIEIQKSIKALLLFIKYSKTSNIKEKFWNAQSHNDMMGNRKFWWKLFVIFILELRQIPILKAKLRLRIFDVHR